MRHLVFNSKGGCGKSLVSREVIAAPIKEQMVIIEIDELNKTQSSYAEKFKQVIQLKRGDVKQLLLYLNEYDNVVVDVGIDVLSQTLNTIIQYGIFEDIDRVVIPVSQGRSDSENALKTYLAIKNHCSDIVFAFTRVDPDEKLSTQYPVLFSNAEKTLGKAITEEDYVTIDNSEIFNDAQNDKTLILEMSEDQNYRAKAFEAKARGDFAKFRALMELEIDRRASKLLVEECILPAHRKLMAST